MITEPSDALTCSRWFRRSLVQGRGDARGTSGAARAQHGRERQRPGELSEREPGDDR